MLRAQISQHVDAIYAGTDHVIKKWTVPVRYRVFGTLSDEQMAQFRRIMLTLKQITKHDIEEDTTPDNQYTNASFIFTNDIRPLLSDPIISRLFRNLGETDADFVRRMVEEFKTNWKKGAGYSDTSTTFKINLVDPATYKGDVRVLFMRAALDLMVDYRASNVLRPSVVNTDTPTLASFPPADIAFLQAIYSDRVRFGQPLQQAKPVIVNTMVVLLTKAGAGQGGFSQQGPRRGTGN